MTTRGNYKGNPTITLKANESDKYGFTFGINKARLILANLEDIRAFVADHATAEDRARQDIAGRDRAYRSTFEDGPCSDIGYEDQCQRATGA